MGNSKKRGAGGKGHRAGSGAKDGNGKIDNREVGIDSHSDCRFGKAISALPNWQSYIPPNFCTE